MAKATVMAVVNQKGGTGKTTTCENLGVGLAMEGKKVLLVDTDPQASLTICLGHPVPDQLSPTLSDMMGKILSEQPIAPGEGILHHPEGVDLMPANIELSGLEVSLVNAMSRETILKQYLDTVKQNYDFILLDCMPSLGMLTVNALAAADNVLIPVQAAYLPAKGLEQLLQTINKVRRQINPKLRIEGILLTMVDSRTNYSKDISNLIRENYGGKLKVYKTDIPRSVRAEEISAEGTSIFKHDPKGKVADAYIRGFEADIQTVTAHPQIAEGFCGMEILGKHYIEKEDAGEMILAACKEMKGTEPIPLGSYRGFQMELSFDSFRHDFDITLKGAVSHRVSLGTDARGNIIRLDNALSSIPEKLEKAHEQLTNLQNQQEATRAELGKPFPQEAELAEKSARLAELDAALNMEDSMPEREEAEQADKPSVLADLKAKSEHIPPYRASSGREEVL